MHSVSEFLKDIAAQLINEFERGIYTTHPGEKGSIGETTARKRISECLPGYVGISTGYVIDSYNNKSNQTDLIIHESACPSFTLGPEQEYRYFPCEGVCAVGEVKTSIGKEELEDCYKKINSVKILRRKPLRNSFRKYGSSQPISAEASNTLDPNNPLYQIIGFVLCKSLKIKLDTLMKHVNELDKTYNNNVPAIFVCLDDGVCMRAKKQDSNMEISYNIPETSFLSFTQFNEDNFPFLINILTSHIQNGNTIAESPIIPYLSQFDSFDSQFISRS